MALATFGIKKNSPQQKIQNNVSREKGASAVSQIIKRISTDAGEIASENELSEVSFSIANSLSDRKKCYQLAYQVYLNKGYVKASANEMILSPFDERDSTMVVMAKDNAGKIVGTLSVILKDKRGLPCFQIFTEESGSFHSGDTVTSEVIRLAIDSDSRNNKSLFIGMFNYVFYYIYSAFECDHTLIEVNPKHVLFYKRLLLFKEISSVRECNRVQGAPAVLLTLDRETLSFIAKKPETDFRYKRSIYPNIFSQASFCNTVCDRVCEQFKGVSEISI